MKITFLLTLLFVISATAQAQDSKAQAAPAHIGALSEQPGLTMEGIHAAAERSAVALEGLEFIIPQFIVGGEWSTSVRLTNRGTAAITAGRALFIDNAGKSLTLSFQTITGSTITSSGFSFTIPQGGFVEGTMLGDRNTVFGHIIIDPASCPSTTACSLYAEAILKNKNSTRPDFESVFPSEEPTNLQYMLFDHRNGNSTVLYLISSNTTVTTVELEFRGTTNQLIRTLSVTLQPAESQILSPHALAPETIGQQGTMIIRGTNTAARALVTATALRINPSNSFTPIRAFTPRP